LGALAVLTLAVSATSIAAEAPALHAAGAIGAATVILAWTENAMPGAWATVALVAAEMVVAYSFAWLAIVRRIRRATTVAAIGAVAVLFISELTLVDVSRASGSPPLGVLIGVHAMNLSLILALAWQRRWQYVAPAAVVPAWLAALGWQQHHPSPSEW